VKAQDDDVACVMLSANSVKSDRVTSATEMGKKDEKWLAEHNERDESDDDHGGSKCAQRCSI
jgi:hypothetical protein